MQFKKRISAFTLIELLVTIVVIGMLSSISVATYNGYISSAKVATIKKTVNDLYRFTILYARETDSYYDEISLAEVLDKFGIKDLGYGNITYVVLGQTDFYYQAILPDGETWTVAFVPSVYAESSSFYANGTQNAMSYFKSLDDGQRSNIIRAAYDEIALKDLKNDALKAGFDLTFVSSPWTQIMPDLDKDLVPDYRDDCPKISGPENNKGCPLVDTDGDGVYDKDDQCPDVAGDKYAWGCPLPDKDNDGVWDEEDKCPKQGGKVDEKGCPIDEVNKEDIDNDGILNEEDKCPERAGEIYNKGCPIDKETESEFGDIDGDGIANAFDECPEKAGLINHPDGKIGCPNEEDIDNDGVLNEEDKCPERAGEIYNKGCPIDKETKSEFGDIDGDGVANAFDECPEKAGLINHPDGKIGCPNEDKK